ncbi:FAD/NAD(P)-binding domain-containing protein [Trichoderma citrinoviride]|uniref:FAD/NAD(P)-binding domain-containing protein n=1 Tax=Trichoderma citrinoviride TaxID=58853 RepID=A0A2T4BIV7_9HYPO|nr:FAD/NAD(P)-binding domain-containing protein [Trichoderma citrinoviride]PTB69247.1 FAD/NAD(P)-binding domain-containing protein [Trichoderma citrinoviride]
MRIFSVFALLPALGGLCQAAYRNHILKPAVQTDYDVIIVGGGPAGLSAASALARVRRNVLLIDSGDYRNAATRHLHDVIGYDGVTPAYFRWIARNQIRDYDTVSLVNGTVTKIQPESDNSYFTVSASYPEDRNLTLTARKIILATGLRDLIPSTPGLRENWAKGIYWCPWCDGHEHADQPLGILGPLEKGPGAVREIITLNQDIILFVNGTDTPDQRTATEEDFPQWEQYLKLHSITIDNRILTSIERLKNGTTGDEDPSLPSVPEHDLFQLNFETGPPVLRAAILTNFETAQKSNLGEETGVALYGGKLAVDPSHGLVTNIPGLFAIGDANSDNTTNIPHAMYSGKKTAVYIQVELETENAEAELSVQSTKTKRGLEDYMRTLWSRMNVPGEVLYAGEFDQ